MSKKRTRGEKCKNNYKINRLRHKGKKKYVEETVEKKIST